MQKFPNDALYDFPFFFLTSPFFFCLLIFLNLHKLNFELLVDFY